ncbi:hypothetical protein FLL45_20955 [Aliikangiella marina]|uniref:Uncharacterized protein n=1 Tax=Aliikangiella marina TaxID=1712262 RepID=A0A545T325_9GAMM|nr:hypothetical protein [Aliikangiella marina]TQV71622.1 hypothetical protein FLL45_20955 [Aliikangiella marina]
MKGIFVKFSLSVLLILVSALFSLEANASYKLCVKKEVSNDGIAWFDANTQAEAVVISDTAHFRFTVIKCPESNGGFVDLTLEDPMLNISEPLEDLAFGFNDPTDRGFTTEVVGFCAGETGYKENIMTVTGLPSLHPELGYQSYSDNAWAYCEDTPVGGDGCTPGYWKQDHHLDSWPVDTNISFYEVFGRSIEIKIKKQGKIYEPSLLQALNASGGQVNMAARHAAAAYLNAMANGVNYDMTANAVIEAFQTSFDNNNYGVLIQNLVDFNEQGCPLN